MTDHRSPSATGGADAGYRHAETAKRYLDLAERNRKMAESANAANESMAEELATCRATLNETVDCLQQAEDATAALRAELAAFQAAAELEVKAWQARSDEHRARAERAEAALRERTGVLEGALIGIGIIAEGALDKDDPKIKDGLLRVITRMHAEALAAPPEAPE